MSPKEREKTLENIALLRRAEGDAQNADVALVREDLEGQLGGTVSRSLAASLLGVSHTALNNWISAGDVPTVISPRGRKEVPIPVVMELREAVEEERRAGRRKLHMLEPVMVEARRRAERIPIGKVAPDSGARSDPHRAPELRSLAYHRAVAHRLRRPVIDAARRKLRRWQREEKIDPRCAEVWEEVFAMPMADIRKAITADDQRGRDLRQNSPLAGLLTEPERRRIMEGV